VHGGGDDVDPVHRQHPRNAAEDAGFVGDDDREDVAIGLDAGRARRQQGDLLRRQLVRRDL
jgi:hypothetical protein